MLDNNMRLGGKVIYDIKPPMNKSGKWYAIFYEKMNTKQMMQEQLKDKK